MTFERIVAACVAVILLFIAVVAWKRRERADISTHGTILLFSTVWALSLGFFAVPWIRYTRTEDLAWAAIYASLISFLGACVVAEHLARSSGSERASFQRERLSPPHLHAAIIGTAILGYIGFAFFLRAINDTVGWTAVFTDLDAARKVQQETQFAQEYGLVKLLTYFSGISLLLWTIALRERTFTGKWRLFAPTGVLVLVPYFLTGERLSLLTIAMWIVGFHLLWREPRSSRVVAIVAITAVLVGFAFFYVIGNRKGATIENHPQVKAHLTTQTLRQFAFPYLYLTANFPVFSKVTTDPIAPRTYGGLTFWPAAKASNLALQRRDYPPKYNAFYDIPFDEYNSATWLGPFYLDFGIAGCIVMPAIFGLVTTLLLMRARRRRTFLDVWLAALGLMIIAFAPLKNAFPDAGTWEYIIMAPLVSLFVVHQAEPGEDSPRRRDVLRDHWLWTTMIVAFVAVAVAVAVTLRFTRTPPPDDNSTQAVSARLIRDGEKLARIYEREDHLSAHALATRLAVSDPSGEYTWFYGLDEVPPLGVVGVFAEADEFRLRSRTSEDRVLEVVGVNRSSKYRVVGPRVLGSGVIVNGDFEDPLGPPWEISSRRGVRATTTTDAMEGAYSLHLRYRRPIATAPTSVRQLVRRLPVRAPGTRYTLREVVRTQGLSRQVVCGFQLVYRDGTSVYVAGTTGSRPAKVNSRATGILAGSGGPKRITASRVATKPVSAIRIFAVDAGSAPVQGLIQVDDVQLEVNPGGGG